MYLTKTRKDVFTRIGAELMKSPTIREAWFAYVNSPFAQAVAKNAGILTAIVAVDLILKLPPSGRMLYLLPVFGVTRAAGLRAGIFFSAAATVVGAEMDHIAGLGDTWLLNSLVRFTALALLAFSVDGMVDRLKVTNDVARHDTLTGALNRHGFDESGNTIIANAILDNDNVVVAVIDLDDFKPVNDLYGHAFGDKILQTLVECFTPAIADAGLIARIGGDEFQLLFTGEPIEAVEQLIIRALNRFSDATLVLGHRATFSYGIASLHAHGTTLEQLMSAADAAMYLRKAHKGRRSTDRLCVVRNA
jgi:diguanylate cyclase (GGDEF)-like protein